MGRAPLPNRSPPHKHLFDKAFNRVLVRRLLEIETYRTMALIGLPLIATSELLRAAGVDLLPAPEVQP